LSEGGDAAIGSSTPGHYGPAPGGVTLGETLLAVAWNVQGDAARSPFAIEAPRLLGIELPGAPNGTRRNGALTALWLGPTSWLLVSGSADALTDFETRRDAIKAASGFLFDVTASCSAWTIGGARTEAALASASPLDFASRAFPDRSCAQSTFGNVNTLFYRRSASSFALIVARSHARGVWRALCAAAGPYGYDVVRPSAFV